MPRSSATRIAWLVPPWIEGSGGHRTMLQNIGALIAAGYECDVYVERKDDSGLTPEQAEEAARRDAQRFFNYTNPGIYSGFHLRRDYDMVVATAWWTAHVAARLNVPHKAYFVQDFEALFNPMGDGFLMAENSYRLGLQPVTIGRWLAHKLTTEFASPAAWFEFCADRLIYRPLPDAPRENAVCFIYQPEKPRRCPTLGLDALRIVRHARPDVKILLYGTRATTGFPLQHEHLGLLGVEECNRLYNRCRVGLCISSSNPSRIPFEMMAAGLPVVDLHRDNNLYDMPEGGVLLARQTPEEIARAILLILEDDERFRRMSEFGPRFMAERTLEHGYRQAVLAFEEILQGRTAHWKERASAIRPSYRLAPDLPHSRTPLRTVGRPMAHLELKRAAERELQEIEGSRAWRLVRSVKQNPIYRVYAFARYGPGWNAIHSDPDPCSRLDRIRASRTYRVLVRLKDSGLYRRYRSIIARWNVEPRGNDIQAQLATFDVWDTLLRRRCHPDEVKLFTARHVHVHLRARLRDPDATPWSLMEARIRIERRIGAQRRNIDGVDDEYDIIEVLTAWLEEVCDLAPDQRAAELAEQIAQRELEQEIHVSYPDIRGLELARQARTARRAAVSDFYMGEPFLRRILEAHAPDVRFDHVFVSCDCRLNKRSGRLFQHIHRTLGVTPDAHIHVGDNHASDVENARALGVHATHFRHPPEDERHADHQERFSHRPHALDSTVELLDRDIRAASRPPEEYTPKQRELFHAGARMAPVFAGLVMLAAEEAIRLGAPTVFYFTREGEFFRRIHLAMAPVEPTGAPLPRATLLHVSRMSTFFPSLRDFTPEELMRIWTMYSSQSMSQLFDSFHVPLFATEPFLRRYGIEPKETICGPWRDNRARAFLKDPLVRHLLARAQDERRNLLFQYFGRRGFTRDLEHAVIVDIGWRGTIQDNIAILFPKTQIHGFYLGLLKFLNPQPPNAFKTAFGPDANRDEPAIADIIRFVVPFEMVSNSGNGSVREYVRNPQGESVPAALIDPGESRVYEQFTKYFQAGAIAAAPEVARWMRRHAVTPQEMRPFCLQLMKSLAFDPPRVLTEAFFALTHNETFGGGTFVKKGANLPRAKLIAARFSRRAWEDFVKYCEDTTWPHGFLRYYRRRRELKRYIETATQHQPPHVPTSHEIIEAKRQLDLIESSAAWKLVMSMKRLPIYRFYARKRWGEGWNHSFDNETPVQRLNRLRRGMAYRVLRRTGALRDHTPRRHADTPHA